MNIWALTNSLAISVHRKLVEISSRIYGRYVDYQAQKLGLEPVIKLDFIGKIVDGQSN